MLYISPMKFCFMLQTMEIVDVMASWTTSSKQVIFQDGVGHNNVLRNSEAVLWELFTSHSQ